jgi:CelD/BcsL family acetyltransferase involved in cellulose biosynthesis
MQGFDPEWYDYSPSFCNISRLIEHAHDNGYAYVDFLRGDEEYKHRFANTQVDMVKFVAVLNSQVDKEELFAFLNKYEE